MESYWQPWLGIAFETFCLKHAMIMAESAGFPDEVISFAPLFSDKDRKTERVIVQVCEEVRKLSSRTHSD